eukprot:2180268-Prymnesium_polylepis.2
MSFSSALSASPSVVESAASASMPSKPACHNRVGCHIREGRHMREGCHIRERCHIGERRHMREHRAFSSLARARLLGDGASSSSPSTAPWQSSALRSLSVVSTIAPN